MRPDRPKFATIENGEPTRVHYGNRYWRESLPDGERLTIGPQANSIGVLLNLAKLCPGPYSLLYVLLEPRGTKIEPGRYQYPVELDFDKLEHFLDRYRGFFEDDGRHHLWIYSLASESALVYDNHEIIFAYGDLDAFERSLRHSGFLEDAFEAPYPHIHGYHPEHDSELASLLLHTWTHSPLLETDE